MSDTTAANQGNGDPEGSQEQGEQQKQEQEATFTQADVDKLTAKVRSEERRKAAEKFADYDDLKVKAGEKATVEDRLAAMEKRAADAEAAALRADVANKHGISAEDRDLFLTGADEATLTAQAERLSARETERKQQGNHVPNEGNPQKPIGNTPADQFAAAVEGLI